jgi:apolipoprotein N-acyltransferase
MPRLRQRVRQLTHTLGIVGISFLVALALALLFYFTGHGALLALDILALIALGAILAFPRFSARPAPIAREPS